MNKDIEIPDLSCPVQEPISKGFYTDEQSVLNVARTDKFNLILDVPNILKPHLQRNDRLCRSGNLHRLEMSVWGYLVPTISIEKIERAFGGQTFKASSLARPSYEPITVNFTVDNRFDNYFLLWKWLDIQNDEEEGVFNAKHLGGQQYSGHLPSYSTTITIQAHDEYNKPIAEWVFFGAFITSIGGLNAQQRGFEEMESTFTFEFSQLKMNIL